MRLFSFFLSILVVVLPLFLIFVEYRMRFGKKSSKLAFLHLPFIIFVA